MIMDTLYDMLFDLFEHFKNEIPYNEGNGESDVDWSKCIPSREDFERHADDVDWLKLFDCSSKFFDRLEESDVDWSKCIPSRG